MQWQSSLVGYAIRLSLSENRQQNELRVRQGAEINLVAARDQLDRSFQEAQQWAIELHQLSELGQLLQSCLTEHEAYLLIGTALNKLLPECSGALYTMTAEGQRVEVISQWGSHPPMEKVFDPAQCWGVRRGLAHYWDRGTTPVRCAHLVLLQDCNATPEQTDRCRSKWSKIQRVGTAVAEQTALTQANLRLRSALREQAIRDPLTALFNRRYLEETLERELQHGCRGTTAEVCTRCPEHRSEGQATTLALTCEEAQPCGGCFTRNTVSPLIARTAPTTSNPPRKFPVALRNHPMM